MREIKFRAWTKKKEMQYNVVPFHWDYVIDKMWHKCIESNGLGILGSGGTEAKFEVRGFAIEEGNIMQFTGLCDDNGVEIYEGDIISNLVAQWIIVFNTGCFCGQMKGHEIKEGDMFIALRAIKGKLIIGNIYENPELLI